jgi:hypothetical protein
MYDERLRIFQCTASSDFNYETIDNTKNNLKEKYKWVTENNGNRRKLTQAPLQCSVCGKTEIDYEITAAHIAIPRKDFPYYYSCFGKENRYKDECDPVSDRNFILLCGNQGSNHKSNDGTGYASCYSLFDRFEMIILYDPFQQSYRCWCAEEGHPLENLTSPTGNRVNIHEDHQPYRRLLVWRARQAFQQKSLLYKGIKLGDLQTYGNLSLETTSMSDNDDRADDAKTSSTLSELVE